MTLRGLTWFVRRAMRRRDNGNSVDISNGHWLIRVPADIYPNAYTRFTGTRDDWDLNWTEGWEPQNSVESVMPVPLDSAIDQLVECDRVSDGLDNVGWQFMRENRTPCGGRYYPLMTNGTKIVYVNADYFDRLQKIGLGFWVTKDRNATTPIVLVDGDNVAGALMPIRSPSYPQPPLTPEEDVEEVRP